MKEKVRLWLDLISHTVTTLIGGGVSGVGVYVGRGGVITAGGIGVGRGGLYIYVCVCVGVCVGVVWCVVVCVCVCVCVCGWSKSSHTPSWSHLTSPCSP